MTQQKMVEVFNNEENERRRRHRLDIAVCSTTSRMHRKELQLHNLFDPTVSLSLTRRKAGKTRFQDRRVSNETSTGSEVTREPAHCNNVTTQPRSADMHLVHEGKNTFVCSAPAHVTFGPRA